MATGAALAVALTLLSVGGGPARPTAAAPRGVTFSGGAITINDSALAPTQASPYPSSIIVSGVVGTITTMTVTLSSFSHAFPDDVDILLVGPTGANAIIMSDVGGSIGVSSITLVLDDAAASSMPDAGTLTSGTFKPTNVGPGDAFPTQAPAGTSALSVFNGTDPNGTWRLFVVDDANGQAGAIVGWTLDFVGLVAETPTPTSTNTATNTAVPATATSTNTPTNTPVPPTATATNTPTNTPVPATATPTDTPTNTPVPATATPTDTPTNTPVPATRTPTDTPTNTPVAPTRTPTDTPTSTPTSSTATPTLPATITRTTTASVTVSSTPTATAPIATPTPTPTATSTPVAPPTSTPTASPTLVSTSTATVTPAAPTRTPTPVIPEPPTMLLFGSGLLGLAWLLRRRGR